MLRRSLGASLIQRYRERPSLLRGKAQYAYENVARLVLVAYGLAAKWQVYYAAHARNLSGVSADRIGDVRRDCESVRLCAHDDGPLHRIDSLSTHPLVLATIGSGAGSVHRYFGGFVVLESPEILAVDGFRGADVCSYTRGGRQDLNRRVFGKGTRCR